MDHNNHPSKENASTRSQDANKAQDVVVLEMWESIKSLESKYIDLANYYKHELLNSAKYSSHPTIQTEWSYGEAPNSQRSNWNKSAVGGVVQSSHTPQGRDGSNVKFDQREDFIINELKQEKVRFEQVLHQMLQLPPSDRPVGTLNSSTFSNSEIQRFNMELQDAFKEVSDEVSRVMQETASDLNKRQTEMFQITTKHRLSPGIKNESITIWYEAKNHLNGVMSRLKQLVDERQQSVMAQMLRPSSEMRQRGVSKENYLTLIRKFEEDMVNLRKNTREYNRCIVSLQSEIQGAEEALKRDKLSVRADFKELVDSIYTTNEILTSRHQLSLNNSSQTAALLQESLSHQLKQQKPQNPSLRQPSPTGTLIMSPFDKKVNDFQQTALNRSSSRGPVGHISKPPKIGSNQLGLKKLSNSGFSNITSPSRSQAEIDQSVKSQKTNQPIEWHPDLRMVKNKLSQYDNSVSQLLLDFQAKQERVNQTVELVETHVQKALMTFLNTHDHFLVREYFTNTVLTPTETARILASVNATASQLTATQDISKSQNRKSISPFRQKAQSTSGQRKTTTPTRSGNKSDFSSVSNNATTPNKDLQISGRFNTIDDVKLRQTGVTSQSLSMELKRANQEITSQQVENRKLKDQIQILSLQIENLKLQTTKQNQNQKSHQVLSAGSGSLEGERKEIDFDLAQRMQTLMDDNNNETLELCRRIDQFFVAMKQLQKAFNKKEDISGLKTDFENKQLALQKLKKQISQKIQKALEEHPKREEQKNELSLEGHRQVRRKTSSPLPENVQVGNLREMLNQQEKRVRELEEENLKMKVELRDSLLTSIKTIDITLNQKYAEVRKRLETKETEIDRIKRLFVEKLRQLESNFAEIGDHLIASQKVEKHKKEEDVKSSNLLKFLNQESDSNTHHDQTLDELSRTNQLLHDQIAELKQKYKDSVEQDKYIEKEGRVRLLEEEVENGVKERLQLVKTVDRLTKEKEQGMEELQKYRRERQQMQVDLSVAQQQAKQAQFEKESADMVIKQSMSEIEVKLKEQMDLRVIAQKEAKESEELVAELERDNENMVKKIRELEGLKQESRKREEELMTRLEESEEKEEDLKRMLREAEEDFKERVCEWEDQRSKQQEQIELLMDELAATKDVDSELERVTNLLSDKEQLLAESQLKVIQLEEEKEESKWTIEEREEEVSRLNREVTRLEEELKKREEEEKVNEDRIKQDHQQFSEKIALMKEETDQLVQFHIDQAKDVENKLVKQMENTQRLMEETESIKEQNKEFKEQIDKLNEELEQLKEERRQEQAELNREQSNQNLVDQISNLTQQLDQANLKLHQLQQDYDSALYQHSFSIHALNQQLSLQTDQLNQDFDQTLRDRDQAINDREQAIIEREQALIDKQKAVKDSLEAIEDRDLAIKDRDQAINDRDQAVNDKEKALKDRDQAIKDRDQAINDRDQAVNDKEKALSDRDEAINDREQAINDKDEAVIERDEAVKIKDQLIIDRDEALKDRDQAIKEKVQAINERDQAITDKEKAMKDRDEAIKDRDEAINDKDKAVKEKDEADKNMNQALKDKDDTIKERDIQVKERDETVKEKDKAIKERDEAIKNKEKAEDEKVKLMKERDQHVLERDEAVKEKDRAVEERERAEQERDRAVEDRNKAIEEKVKAIQERDKAIEQREEIKLEKEGVQQEVKRTIEERDRAVDEKSKVREQLERLEKSIEGKVESEIESTGKFIQIQNSNNQLSQQIISQQEQLLRQREQISQLEETNGNQQQQLSEVREDLRRLLDEKRQIESDRDSLKEQLKDNQNLLESANSSTLQLQNQIQSLNDQLLQTSDSLSQIKSDYSHLQNLLQSERDDRNQLETDLKSKIEKAELDLQSHMSAFNDLFGKTQEQAKKIDQLSEQRDEYLERISELESRIEEMSKETRPKRASIGSDEEFSSVQEMKEHLKHFRQILTQFIQKLPYSAPDNEATLPVIFSMFEFSKEESEKIQFNRRQHNERLVESMGKEKKNLLGMLLPKGKQKKGVRTDSSFHSEGCHTQNSEK